MVALTMTIVSAVAANNGDYALAEFAGNIGKVAGFIAIVAGFVNMTNQVSNMAKAAATEAAKNESMKFIAQQQLKLVTTETMKEAWTTELTKLGSSDMLGVIMENALNTGVDGFMNMANKALSIVSKLYEMYAKNELKDIEIENQKLTTATSTLKQEMALNEDNNQQLYIMSLDPYLAMNINSSPLEKLSNRYYTEAEYQGDKFQVMVNGPYKGIHLT